MVHWNTRNKCEMITKPEKKRIFWDTNVLVDLLAERDPFYVDAALIASMCDRGEIEISVSSLSFSNVAYVMRRLERDEILRKKLSMFASLVKIIHTNDIILNRALSGGFADLEDAIQYYSALEAGASILLTRNPADFKAAKISVLSPSAFLASCITQSE
ncbi:MAG: PIN domain-containing protein [Bacteroidetes bacterium]|nr:PIN domain-containing protein [Bacteroidota bacterium]